MRNNFLDQRFQECDFVKLRGDSYLRVVYMGNIRITGCTACCKRWFFTFNGAECKVPAPIDGSLYQSANINVHRPTSIEGYCGGIAAGKVRVGFSVGNCGRVCLLTPMGMLTQALTRPTELSLKKLSHQSVKS